MAIPRVKGPCLVACIVTTTLFSSSVNANNEVDSKHQEPPVAAVKEMSWSLRLPKEEKVIFKGDFNFDSAGQGSGSMMYPAIGGIGGLFAAIITHGLIVEGVRSGQKSTIEQKADEVLLPYKTVLNGYRNQELMQAGLKKITSSGSQNLILSSETPGTGQLVESVPVFSLTQDQSTIILENVISIYDANTPATAKYQNIIKVISQVNPGTDAINYWTANQGEKLKEESSTLFANSLDLAINDMANHKAEDDMPQKTFRYFEGGTEKMERGQLVSAKCNRVVIKTLRGWLMSMPTRQSTSGTLGDEKCDAVQSSTSQAALRLTQ